MSFNFLSQRLGTIEAMMVKSAALFALLLLLTGCARVSTTTKLAADGTYSRTSVYTITKGNMGNAKQTTFHSIFVLPDPDKGGPKWTQSEDKDEKHLTVLTTGSPENPAKGEVGILNDEGKPILRSRGTVTKLSDGNLQYDENIEWVGEPKAIDPAGIKQVTGVLKTGLPSKYWQDDKLSTLGEKLERQLLGKFLGPPTPMLASMLTNPDLGKIMITDQLVDLYAQDLKEAFPDITDGEVKSSVSNLEKLDFSNVKELDMKGPAQTGSGVGETSCLAFVLEFPGKIVSTNGIVTKTGKVYWSLYPQAATYQKVILTAVVDPR